MVVPPVKEFTKYIIERIGNCLHSEFKIHGLTDKRDFYCAAHCLNIIYQTKVLGKDFISAVLNLYYQTIS